MPRAPILMEKKLKISAGIAAGTITVLALALLALTAFDWNRAKPWLEARVSDATQRTFAINGDLTLTWQRPTQEQGWRRWVPWPHLRAKDVVLGNVDWASTGAEMARIMQIDFNVNPLLLLRKTIHVQSLIMTEPRLVLEVDSKGRNNWDFPKRESGWRLDLLDLATTRGTIRYVDAGKRADMTARVDTLDDNSVVWKVSGKFNDEPITGSAKSGALLSLQARGVPYPIDGKVVVGQSTIIVKGTLTDPAHPSALDVDVKLLGASMADLFPLSGVLLPETPKFSTEGRVVGTLGRGNLRLRYEKFTGKVGSSDIGGTLEYMQKQPRPLLRGDVVSNHLNLDDLGAVVGAGEGKKKQKSGEVKQPPDKILPVSPFKTDRWGKMDAEVQFAGKEIIRSDNLPIDDLHTKVRMDNGVLSLTPLSFGVAGGKLMTELTIDGRSDPAQARMKVSARNLQLKALFPSIKEMRSSLGQVYGDAQLTAAGNSFAALAGTANGEVKALITEGTVSEFIMEAIGLNVGRMVVSKMFGDRQVNLNCMAADLGVTDGLMRPRFFLVDTEDAIIRIDGDISLANETLDLTIHPQSKGMRLFSLRSPLYVKGTFKKPDVGVNKTIVGLKAGAAVALGSIASPLAALLALTHPGPEEDSPCGTLLAEAQKKPVAPPPGKSEPRATSPRQPTTNRLPQSGSAAQH
jgi:uncharacterized protein involved in outer membrane biogenesis